MVKTRSARKKLKSIKRKTRRVYRKRVKYSQCRGKRGRTCNKTKSCKYASGKKRSFCRRKKNMKVRVLPK